MNWISQASLRNAMQIFTFLMSFSVSYHRGRGKGLWRALPGSFPARPLAAPRRSNEVNVGTFTSTSGPVLCSFPRFLPREVNVGTPTLTSRSVLCSYPRISPREVNVGTSTSTSGPPKQKPGPPKEGRPGNCRIKRLAYSALICSSVSPEYLAIVSTGT